jgi:hypothetical protein
MIAMEIAASKIKMTLDCVVQLEIRHRQNPKFAKYSEIVAKDLSQLFLFGR